MAPENLLVGIVALALLPLVALRIARALREGRVPIYRTYLRREESSARFHLLLALHALSFLLIATVAADLLFNLGLREML
ncbi:MAG TPA: hypothetical protein VEW71_07950 [Allosphingosinicella sp.]|nr:hypothetical protein [Allosphingosinicella sp.]